VKGDNFMSIEELIELRDKTIMEAEELIRRKYSQSERKIIPYFFSEDQKELFKMKVLELILNENIIELQNIIKVDFIDYRQNKESKWQILYNLMNEEYIDKKTLILSFNIDKILTVEENYNILESIPTITEKGKEELKRLKKIYGE